jgi:hypothetical protein
MDEDSETVLRNYLTNAQRIALESTQTYAQAQDVLHATQILKNAERQSTPDIAIPAEIYEDSRRAPENRIAFFAGPTGKRISTELINRGFRADILTSTPVDELMELVLRPNRRGRMARLFGLGSEDEDLITPFRYMSNDEANYRTFTLPRAARFSQEASDDYEDTVKPETQRGIDRRLIGHRAKVIRQNMRKKSIIQLDDGTGGRAAPMLGFEAPEYLPTRPARLENIDRYIRGEVARRFT